MSHNKVTVNAQTPSATGDISLASTDLSDTADLARLASPALTGTPTAPTAPAATNNTQIATTQYVDSAVSGATGGATYHAQTLSADLTLSASSDSRKVYALTSSANRTVTLPSASAMSSGQIIDIKSLSNVTFTLDVDTGDYLDDVLNGSLSIAVQYASVSIITDGAQRWVIV